MNDLTSERTPPVIAAEINMITHQTRKIMLTCAIEIGRRLKEAKGLVRHGEWGKWLEESVSYSQSSAAKLMRLFEEYGSAFPDGPGLSANSEPVPNLTYTQALLLLGLPEEERTEFLAQSDMASMTNRELRQALKERDRARQEQEQAYQEYEAIKKGLETINNTLAALKKEQAKAPEQPDHPENAPEEDPVAAAPSPDSDTPLPTHNLPTEIAPGAAAKHAERCDACCRAISTAFFELTTALTNLTHLDATLKENKRKAAQKLLESIAETIKEWPPAKKPLKVIQ